MKGLLLKDWYMLKKSFLMYVAIALAFQTVPFSGGIITVLYAASLPISAFAWDDRSRWAELASMLPCSVREIVLSRYLLGWGCCLVMNLAAIAGQAVLSVILPGYADKLFMDGLTSFVLLLSISLLFLAFTLPLNFRFDTEKSRLVRFFLIALIAGATGAIMGVSSASIIGRASGGGKAVFDGAFLAMSLVLALLATAVSIPLSMWAYRVRHR